MLFGERPAIFEQPWGYWSTFWGPHSQLYPAHAIRPKQFFREVFGRDQFGIVPVPVPGGFEAGAGFIGVFFKKPIISVFIGFQFSGRNILNATRQHRE